MKPNYKTSEFWFTLVSFIISGLFLSGIITDSDTKDDLIDAITHGVESIILIGGQATILYRYINSRKEERIEYEKTKQKEEDNLHKELEDYVGIEDEVININEANVGELIKLPHIGPATAKKIVEYRNKHGKFLHTKELLRIAGVGESTYENIKENISL
jgi:competence ComEA-like helix-hairpin-helix protein